MEPRERALDDPRACGPSDCRGRRSGARAAGGCRALQCGAVTIGVVAAIALDHGGAPRGASRASADRRQRIDQRQQGGDVRTIRRGQLRDERDAVRFREEVVLAARLAAIGWVRSSFFPRAAHGPTRCPPPRGPGPAGRDGAARSAALRATAATRRPAATPRSGANTPCPSHSPSPSGAGAKAVRCARRTGCPSARPDRERGARPAYWRLRAGRGGNNGSINAHRSSSTRNVAIGDCLPRSYATVQTRDRVQVLISQRTLKPKAQGLRPNCSGIRGSRCAAPW